MYGRIPARIRPAGILYKMHYKMVPDSYQKNKILMHLLGVCIQSVSVNVPSLKLYIFFSFILDDDWLQYALLAMLAVSIISPSIFVNHLLNLSWYSALGVELSLPLKIS